MTFQSSSDPQDYPRMTPAVQALIASNVAMLFLQWTIGGMLPVLRPDLLAYSGDPLQAWWTPITYMFVHAGLWHLALNMYTLWIFGPRIEHVWGTKRFVWFYIWCGLGGVLAHALFGPSGSSLVGASAAVFGVMLVLLLPLAASAAFLWARGPASARKLLLTLALAALIGVGGGAALGNEHVGRSPRTRSHHPVRQRR
jgi:membrane associated rhomboid family serine protease